MTNFDYYISVFPFASIGAAAERILSIDPAACIINCRRCMEAGVKWMYSVDSGLTLPYDTRLVSLIGNEDFREAVGRDLWRRMKLIRILGNESAHEMKKLNRSQGIACLENLFYFLDYLAYCYSDIYEERQFDYQLLEQKPDSVSDSAPLSPEFTDIDLKALLAENAALKEELTARRKIQRSNYTPKPLNMSEADTRRIYIDSMLLDAGWIRGQNWIDEDAIVGMRSRSGKGRADYVLYGDDGKPLAVVEAKKTSADPARGRQEANDYADALEKRYGRRPVIFLTNDFETRIIDGQYPERECVAVWSKRDLEKWFNLRSGRKSLKTVFPDRNIAGRYYQEAAIRAVCNAFQANRRKALLVMATGSGKTRTVIALCKILLDYGWAKNILFLADRKSLIRQAKRNFVNFLPNLSVTNLVEEKDNYSARCVFSTYPTMAGLIDEASDNDGRVFTCGHFDLVICDEAHRSIYNKYRDIFNYFDAPLVGLVDKNTYDVFELPDGIPTYGYELAQAVRDGFLVNYLSIESRLKFIEDGVTYDELTDEEKEEYERTFADENGELPDKITSAALNEWLFNEDTIRQALDIVMSNGLKIQYGEKIGKTIIFAKNHRHAEEILRIFNREYPHLTGFAAVIDNYLAHAQNAIDAFSNPLQLPQIAISVDMLDTGIDVPEILNLVFFKQVRSKAKFWQMIGRGTRLCEGLLDGADKKKFYIFDFCGNFEFFRMGGKSEGQSMISLQSAIFHLKAEIAYKLQDDAYRTEELSNFRNRLICELSAKVQELNRENFAVKQHLRYVERFSNPNQYAVLTFPDTLDLRDEVAPLIPPDGDEVSAVRFDALLYGIELAYLIGKKYGRARNELIKKISDVAKTPNIPEIASQKGLIEKILHTDYIDRAGINEFENIREKLRTLMKYLSSEDRIYRTNFTDDLLSVEWNEAELENDDLKNYKARAEYYIRQHQNEGAVAKLRGNIPLTQTDVKTLEQILWNEAGSREEYEAEYRRKPLGELVREIVGMDMNAAKAAFADYLEDSGLNSRQIYFVNQIVEYIVRNGMMKNLSVLQEPPFTNQGSIAELFQDLTIFTGIKRAIEKINANAAA